MRETVRELAQVVAVSLLALLLASLALGTLPTPSLELGGTCSALTQPGPGAGWLHRTARLLRTGLTLSFCDSPITRGSIVSGTARAAITTGTLVCSATLCSVLLAIPLGMRLARPGPSWLARLSWRVADALSSLPVLVWCTLLFVMLARGFAVIPGDARHPFITLAAAVIAVLSGDRMLADLVQRVETATRSILAEPYMRTVQAGGFGVSAHLARSLVSPIASAVLGRVMFLVSGAIVVELVFDLPGLGALIRQSLGRATPDPNVALAATMALIIFGAVVRAAHRGATRLVDGRGDTHL